MTYPAGRRASSLEIDNWYHALALHGLGPDWFLVAEVPGNARRAIKRELQSYDTWLGMRTLTVRSSVHCVDAESYETYLTVQGDAPALDATAAGYFVRLERRPGQLLPRHYQLTLGWCGGLQEAQERGLPTLADHPAAGFGALFLDWLMKQENIRIGRWHLGAGTFKGAWRGLEEGQSKADLADYLNWFDTRPLVGQRPWTWGLERVSVGPHWYFTVSMPAAQLARAERLVQSLDPEGFVYLEKAGKWVFVDRQSAIRRSPLTETGADFLLRATGHIMEWSANRNGFDFDIAVGNGMADRDLCLEETRVIRALLSCPDIDIQFWAIAGGGSGKTTIVASGDEKNSLFAYLDGDVTLWPER